MKNSNLKRLFWHIAAASAVFLGGCSSSDPQEPSPPSGSGAGPSTQIPGEGEPPAGCPAGSEDCGAGCTRLEDNAFHCGACGVVCQAGQACVQGQCVCPSGTESCQDSCVETSSAPEHCGGCGVACEEGSVCSLGSCENECAEGLTECERACVSLDDSVLHCGACNQACAPGLSCQSGECVCPGAGSSFCESSGSCVQLDSDPANCGSCGTVCASGVCTAGTCQPVEENPGTGGGNGTGGTGGGSNSCDAGSTTTQWASSCRTTKISCTPGTWRAPATGSNGHPLRYESEHFAVYWYENAPGRDDLRGLARIPSEQEVRSALNQLEAIWEGYFGSPFFMQEPYCSSANKWKATVHLDDLYPLWGGSWSGSGNNYMGLWVGVGALADRWGLAHEFMHGVQATAAGFPECGNRGEGCWLFESHANWAPHQLFREDVHCSEMLVNAPHLYYGSTRNRYCNWQFFEFLKDKHCYEAVNEMWTAPLESGARDPWQKLMRNQGWNIAQLNDLFGEWAMHNVIWDYKNPPPSNQSDQGAIYRQRYGSITDTSRVERSNRLTRLEALDEGWSSNRRFVSPYYWAPQRWGYNVVRLFPEPDATTVSVKFRGVTQSGADSGWRWGLVATNAALTQARYSELQADTSGELSFCITPGEQVFLVVLAAPSQYQKITWQTHASDGTPYPNIYRYPYMIEVAGAWPQGFQNGAREACPSGTVRHANGGGCAPSGTPASVYVGPYARVLPGAQVSGNARIEDQATILNTGRVSGTARVGAMTLLRGFTVQDSAQVQSVFMPMNQFGNNLNASGSARLFGDLEVYSSKNQNVFFGLVNDGWSGQTPASVNDITVAPPYSWRN